MIDLTSPENEIVDLTVSPPPPPPPPPPPLPPSQRSSPDVVEVSPEYHTPRRRRHRDSPEVITDSPSFIETHRRHKRKGLSSPFRADPNESRRSRSKTRGARFTPPNVASGSVVARHVTESPLEDSEESESESLAPRWKFVKEYRRAKNVNRKVANEKYNRAVELVLFSRKHMGSQRPPFETL
jgi:hypothetical protein